MLDGIKQMLRPEIYFTMDVEGTRTLETGVPTTYFIDYPLDLPKSCYKAVGLHVHIPSDELERLSYEEVYAILKERKERLELKTGKVSYFRPGWCIIHPKLNKAAEELGMKIVRTNVRYFTAWLPKKRIVIIVHSQDSSLLIKLLIFYLKLFHPFAEWKIFK